jgi:hypothetical protein
MSTREAQRNFMSKVAGQLSISIHGDNLKFLARGIPLAIAETDPHGSVTNVDLQTEANSTPEYSQSLSKIKIRKYILDLVVGTIRQ